MINIKNTAEKMVPSSEGEEEGGKENGDVGEKEKAPLATDKPEELIPSPVPPEVKKTAVLNLNNEVVKMRKDVKRVRALIIRKLTRQISALKKKKGNEKEVERNQRRADRLLEEIHAMKTLKPDLVTKTALQKNLNFEQVCKNPKSKIADRAVARIATHPQFNRKIQDIKGSVEAFKEERVTDGKKRGRKGKAQSRAENVPPSDGERKDVEDKSAEQKEMNNAEGGGFSDDTGDVTVGRTATGDTADVQKKEAQPSTSTTQAPTKSSEAKVIGKNQPENKVTKSNVKPAPKALQKKEQGESEVESSDDEKKEYFDDSTEERFYKQSSQSDDSDGEDDFFLGKVSRFKKRKKKSTEGKKPPEQKEDPVDLLAMSEHVPSELRELESRLKSKAAKLQSVFCSTLSGTTADGHKGSNQFRGQGNPKGGGGRNTSYIGQPVYKKHPGSEGKSFASAGRGRGRGRGDFTRQKDLKGGRVFSHQAPQQALHPSWEASKKRKEQQGQILAFQGKKIKFDDDD